MYFILLLLCNQGGEVPATATLISNEAEFGHGFTIAGTVYITDNIYGLYNLIMYPNKMWLLHCYHSLYPFHCNYKSHLYLYLYLCSLYSNNKYVLCVYVITRH